MLPTIPVVWGIGLSATLVVSAMACGTAGAQSIPLPRPRPFSAVMGVPSPPPKPGAVSPSPPLAAPTDAISPTAQLDAAPSACRLRLTAVLAVAPSVPPVEGPGECGASDLVRLETIVLEDAGRVAVNPPATLRCTMAEAVVGFVRAQAAELGQDLGSPLAALSNYDSYNCRSRNRIVGARTSEHGNGNALDLRGLTLGNGRFVGLTDPQVVRGFRERFRAGMCARFTTVLGPGSDGYHEDHVHLDLAERRSGYRICQWDVRDLPR